MRATYLFLFYRPLTRPNYRTLNLEDTIAIIVSSVVFALILCGFYVYRWRRNRRYRQNEKTQAHANPFSDQPAIASNGVRRRFSTSAFTVAHLFCVYRKYSLELILYMFSLSPLSLCSGSHVLMYNLYNISQELLVIILLCRFNTVS